MFHFLVGEMTLSLEDVVMLGGLSCAGEAMEPIDVPATWHSNFLVGSRTFLGTIARQRRHPRSHLDLDPTV
jgi:hypothetical protein